MQHAKERRRDSSKNTIHPDKEVHPTSSFYLTEIGGDVNVVPSFVIVWNYNKGTNRDWSRNIVQEQETVS
jgi:MoaA/NifB/PqqE/SkfB family radical SAM enzyme